MQVGKEERSPLERQGDTDPSVRVRLNGQVGDKPTKTVQSSGDEALEARRRGDIWECSLCLFVGYRHKAPDP